MAAPEKSPVRVRVVLSSSLRHYRPDYDAQSGLDFSLPGGTDMAGLMAALGIPAREVKVIMVNRRPVLPERVLADGDLVGLFPSLGGG